MSSPRNEISQAHLRVILRPDPTLERVRELIPSQYLADASIGERSLMGYAVQNDRWDLVRYLVLECLADPYQPDPAGYDLSDYVFEEDTWELDVLLEDYDARALPPDDFEDEELIVIDDYDTPEMPNLEDYRSSLQRAAKLSVSAPSLSRTADSTRLVIEELAVGFDDDDDFEDEDLVVIADYETPAMPDPQSSQSSLQKAAGLSVSTPALMGTTASSRLVVDEVIYGFDDDENDDEEEGDLRVTASSTSPSANAQAFTLRSPSFWSIEPSGPSRRRAARTGEPQRVQLGAHLTTGEIGADELAERQRSIFAYTEPSEPELEELADAEQKLIAKLSLVMKRDKNTTLSDVEMLLYATHSPTVSANLFDHFIRAMAKGGP